MKINSCYLLCLIILLLCWLPCLAVARDLVPIRPADTLPESTPWNLKALSRPPAFEWGPGKEIRTLHYKGEPYEGKPTRVFAYYATPGSLAGDPSKDKNLPAVVLVHGGGGQAFERWAQLWAGRGYAAIAMDLAGNGLGRKRLPDGGPGQSDVEKFGSIEKPSSDQWTYHAVANVILAHSIIRSFPEVDPERTAITGISWGGYLTCIVSGLDNRFKASVPVYGCGFLHENSVWLPQFAKMSPQNKAKWVKLWDPSMYVGSAAMPMLFINGGKDFAYPPDSYAKTYDLVKSEKLLRFSPDLPHGHIFDRPRAIEIFINSHLKGGVPLPRVSEPVVGDKYVTVAVETKTKLVSAELYYTTDSFAADREAIKARKWIAKPARIKDNIITVDRAPHDAKAWFITVTDQRGAIVSSKVVLQK
ncbi:MAG: alpha/beta fold hydrolase [Pirellulales bacterium]|nr:alpha/beta fold hydrolase [Pirellulales bacterium]